MDTFSQALLSEKTDIIPDEYDWFAPLLGDWDCDYDDNYDGKPRHVKGEWIFSEITGDSFKWKNVMIKADGTRILDCEIHGKRIKHVSL